MKSPLIIGFAFLVFTALLAQAFLPGPDIIKACPHCEQKIRQSTMLSGNTYHGRHWTDGKAAYPWYPDWPAFVECPKCSGLFWIRDVETLGADEEGSDVGEGARDHKSPSVKKIYEYLGEHDLDVGREHYLRTRLWWKANDRWRTNGGTKKPKALKSSPFSEQEKENLEKLRQLLEEDERDHKITRAEIARELGDFEQCIQILAEVEGEVPALIRSLAERRNTRVQEIEYDEE